MGNIVTQEAASRIKGDPSQVRREQQSIIAHMENRVSLVRCCLRA